MRALEVADLSGGGRKLVKGVCGGALCGDGYPIRSPAWGYEAVLH